MAIFDEIKVTVVTDVVIAFVALWAVKTAGRGWDRTETDVALDAGFERLDLLCLLR